MHRPLFCLLLALSITGCGGERPAHSPGELTIAAASSLRPAVDALVIEWNEQRPDVPARATYGASGALYAQIDSSAPFDLFLSADDVYPRRLFTRGVTGEPFEYATGTIVIWVPDENDPIENLNELSGDRFDRIAIASPNLAPYGEAALEALESIGIYDEMKGKLLFASNASEAAHFAESGGAEMAVLPLSLVIGTDLRQRGSYVVIPSELHDTIIHEGAVVTASPDQEAANAFVEMLLSDEGQALLGRFGFKPPSSIETAGTAAE